MGKFHTSSGLNIQTQVTTYMSPSVLKALERILAPLAKLLLSQGVTHGQVSEMLKVAMVREALHRANSPSMHDGSRIKEPTDSRLSIATGIHRKDVKRLRTQTGPSGLGTEGNTASQVIARWLSMGNPPPLLTRQPIAKGRSKSTGFNNLVQSVSTDIRPRAVLDELLSRGVVSEHSDGRLMIHADRLVMNQDEAALADYLGMNLSDHFNVAVTNLLKEGEPQLDRCVHFHGVSENMAAELNEYAKEQAMQALVAVNSKAQKLAQVKRNHGQFRFNFGTYFRKEEQL
ncbi:MAG: hypothetical protein RLZZ133_31 [Pseudomonadota bacterium]